MFTKFTDDDLLCTKNQQKNSVKGLNSLHISRSIAQFRNVSVFFICL